MDFSPRISSKLLALIAMSFSLFSSSSNAWHHLQKAGKKLNDVCLTSPTDCLRIVEHDLEHAQSERVKLDLIQYKLDALFNLQRWKELGHTLAPWVYDENVPPSFRITILIYYAKLNSITQHNNAKKALSQAVELLEKLQEVYPSPIRLVQLANTYMVMGEHQQAYDLLSNLKKRYGSHNNSYFQLELNGNLGHVTRQMEALEESQRYWQETIPWALKLGNKQQISTVYFNNARVLQLRGIPREVRENLALALKYALESQDIVKETQIRLRMAENFVDMNQACDAQAQLNMVSIELLTGAYTPLYEKLLTSVKC